MQFQDLLYSCSKHTYTVIDEVVKYLLIVFKERMVFIHI